MGLFGSIFGKASGISTEKNNVPWKRLENLEQLNEIETNSQTTPQLIFKHSTTCGISRMVLNLFNDTYDASTNADVYILDLHSFRNVSNAVADKFGILHQSPQLLVIKNGEVTHHASHGGISDLNLKQLL